jgi:hypothetical protein
MLPLQRPSESFRLPNASHLECSTLVTTMPCSQDDCQNEPEWRPALELRTSARSDPHRLRFLRLGYCPEHQRSASLETFLSDEAWRKIAKHVRELGLGKLDPKLTTLVWEPLAPRDLARLASGQDHTLSDQTLPF